ncbi:MAG TPA: hypothetical protein VLM38_19740, partial [Blastocatellia bacterium]|nr:hypothetical protein [Blastocatellia bacterium]
TAPEKLAEHYLEKLHDGEVDIISTLVGTNEYILEEEKGWPIKRWRVANRLDKTDKVELMYWVARGGGYGDIEEEVYLDIGRSAGGWELTGFSAVY